MLIKFMPHGAGSGVAAVTYLMGETDHKGEKREAVEVLRGNPQLLGELIDSLDFVHRYTSGVIAFAPEDKPTREDVDALLNDFEKVAFAGLDGGQYAWSAVCHDDPGSCHVHVIAARVELQTGKSMNIAPPGWERTFYHLRDAWNYEKGWARPDDPERARQFTPNVKEAHLDITKSPKEAITDWLTAQMRHGLISDRSSVLEALRGIGTINRINPKYISVIFEGEKKPIRLKGSIYEEQFNVSAILEADRTARDRQGRDSGEHRAAAERARSELQRAIDRRTEYNRSRYEREPDAPESKRAEERQLAKSGALDAVLDIPGLMPTDRVRSKELELVDDHRSEPANGGIRSGKDTDKTTDSRIDDRVLQHAGGQKDLHWEQEIDEPKRKPKTKWELDRKRADELIAAIGQHSEKSGPIHSTIGAIASGFRQGAQERASANGQHPAANRLIEHVREAIAGLAARANSASRGIGRWIAELAQVVEKSKGIDRER